MWVSVENMGGTWVRLYCCLQIWMKYCKAVATDWLKKWLIYRFFIQAWDLKLEWVPIQEKTFWFPAVIEIGSLMRLSCNHHHHSMPLSCKQISQCWQELKVKTWPSGTRFHWSKQASGKLACYLKLHFGLFRTMIITSCARVLRIVKYGCSVWLQSLDARGILAKANTNKGWLNTYNMKL